MNSDVAARSNDDCFAKRPSRQLDPYRPRLWRTAPPGLSEAPPEVAEQLPAGLVPGSSEGRSAHPEIPMRRDDCTPCPC
jgi:hypothetical protein